MHPLFQPSQRSFLRTRTRALRLVNGRVQVQQTGARPSRSVLLCSCSGGKGLTAVAYVKRTQPTDVDAFVRKQEPQVVAAVKQTVNNVVGTLHGTDYFDVRITTVADNLSQLFTAMLMTGYLFRAASVRMKITSSLASSMFDDAATENSTQVLSPPSSLPTSAAPSASSPSSPSSSSSSSTSSSSPSPSPSPSSPSTSSFSDAETYADVRGSVLEDSGTSTSSSSYQQRSTPTSSTEGYAPGIQMQGVEGDILRWHLEHGVEKVPANEYISMLQAELASLKEALASKEKKTIPKPSRLSDQNIQIIPSALTAPPKPSLERHFSGEDRSLSVLPVTAAAVGSAVLGRDNNLLDYLRALPQQAVNELTSGATPDTVEAMQFFVARLQGTGDNNQLRGTTSEFSGHELSKVLQWLLVVGFELRSIETEGGGALDYTKSNGSPGLLPG